MAKSLNLTLTPLNKSYEVCLPNGHKAKISHQAKNLPYLIQAHKGTVNLHVVPLNLKSIIFGNQWLADTNPTIDWKTKTFTITQGDTTTVINTNPDHDIDWISAKELGLIMSTIDEETHLY